MKLKKKKIHIHICHRGIMQIILKNGDYLNVGLGDEFQLPVYTML